MDARKVREIFAMGPRRNQRYTWINDGVMGCHVSSNSKEKVVFNATKVPQEGGPH